MDKEYRNLAESISIKEDEDKLILEGYAVVFDSETFLGSEERGYYEVIDRNAIDSSALKDVPLKYNHSNENYILARTRNNSLQLNIDDKGLFIHAELQSNVQQHRDVYNMVQSGLLDKMSFAFVVKEHEIDRSGKFPRRTIKKIDKLFDVSIVDTPAYDATSIQARSLDLVETEIKALENEEQRNSLENEQASQKALELYKLKTKIRLGLEN